MANINVRSVKKKLTQYILTKTAKNGFVLNVEIKNKVWEHHKIDRSVSRT